MGDEKDLERELEKQIDQMRAELENANANIEKQIEDMEENFDDQLEAIEERMDELEEEKEEMDDNKDDPQDDSFAKILETLKELEIRKKELKQKKSEEINRLKDQKHKLKEEFRELKDKMKADIKEQIHRLKHDKYTRINFTLPESMREELQQMANKLNMSVSEVLRNSMQTFQNIINQGTNPIKSPIPNEKNTYNDNMTRNPGSMSQPQQSLEVKDQMKRRVKGLLRVHKNQIPINKLAGAMNLSDAEAENIIYELVADDKINGTIENNVFSYSNPVEEVISGLEKIIDQL